MANASINSIALATGTLTWRKRGVGDKNELFKQGTSVDDQQTALRLSRRVLRRLEAARRQVGQEYNRTWRTSALSPNQIDGAGLRAESLSNESLHCPS